MLNSILIIIFHWIILRIAKKFRKNKIRTQLLMVAIAISMAALVVGRASTVQPLIMSAIAQGGLVPGIVVSNNNSTANTTNITATAKPVDGYNTPEGHVSAIRHLFDDPVLRVQHYCKPNDKIVLVCQLYDSDSKNATLIGVIRYITFFIFSF
jgi:hypothetical protein